MEEKAYKIYFDETITRNDDGRFIEHLPFSKTYQIWENRMISQNVDFGLSSESLQKIQISKGNMQGL